MKTIYFNSTFGALALTSFLAQEDQQQFKFANLSFDRHSMASFLQNPDAVVCLSIGSLGDLRMAENLFYLVRQTELNIVGFPKFVLGGAVFSYINCTQWLQYYPEISYIVVGEGYHALRGILNDQPLEQIIYGDDFPSINNVMLDKKLNWHPQRPIPVSLGETNCSWGKCRFCHHLDMETPDRLSIEEFCQKLIHYHQKFGWKNYYIYDNHLEPEELGAILLVLKKKKVKLDLDVFGMRLKKGFIPMAKLLRETNMVRYIGWGLEMYSQSILNLYRKGIKTSTIQPILQAAAEGGAKSIVYILLGLPGCKEEDYTKTHQFLHHHIHETGFIDQVLMNWFLVSDQIADKMKSKQISIRLKKNFCLNQYFGNLDEFSGVDTMFKAFDHWNFETEEWISRDQYLLNQRHVLKDLLSLPSTSYDFRGFFLKNRTWQKFWGNEYSHWLKGHKAAISRMDKSYSFLHTFRKLSSKYQSNISEGVASQV